MSKPKSPVNPFYVLLVIAGIAFAITACAYGVLTIRGIRGTPETPGIMTMLDEHGMAILFIEIAILALLTVAAIGTDTYWIRRDRQQAAADASRHQSTSNPPSSTSSTGTAS